ncbi:MAG TPA: hypothetical protein VHE13_17145 [Opitutus sp.]|nr:hypothetical protein [Opitutus sp.]
MFLSLLCPLLYASWAKPFPINSADGAAGVRHHSAAYLPVIGAAPLRFASAAPRPVVNHPPEPVISAADPATVAPANPGQPAADLATDPDHQDKPPAAPAEPGIVAATPPDTDDKRKKLPPAIIPDDTPVRPRHEDFLPFFQFPGQSAEPDAPGLNVPPAPSTLPASSATYQQR